MTRSKTRIENLLRLDSLRCKRFIINDYLITQAADVCFLLLYRSIIGSDPALSATFAFSLANWRTYVCPLMKLYTYVNSHNSLFLGICIFSYRIKYVDQSSFNKITVQIISNFEIPTYTNFLQIRPKSSNTPMTAVFL